MKQFPLCVLVLAAFCAVTEAQGPSLGNNPPNPTASVSHAVKDRCDLSASSATDHSESKIALASQPPSRTRSQFAVCLENSPFTTEHNEYPRDRRIDTPMPIPPDDLKESDQKDVSFHWSTAIKQSLLFLGVQHGYAITQPKTRRDLRGPFIKDYLRSVQSLRGWGDGGRFFTNYIAHPLEGSLVGFVQVQNDPKGIGVRFGKSHAYWKSRLKALAWSAVWSTQFEIGPISQASIGNVGLHDKQTYVDLVVTPTAGIGVLIAEDALDKSLIQTIERESGSLYVTIVTRMLFNPSRTAANLLRFKKPWYRDTGLR